MKIIICGAGTTGRGIAKYLAKESNDVTVIDIDRKLLQQLATNLDVKTLLGHASYPDVLEKAGAKDADMIIALTNSDEINMITCQVAYSKFNIKKRIARINQDAYLQDDFQKKFYTKDNMPVGTIVSPEKEIIKSIVSRLKLPEAFDNIKLSNALVDVVGVICKNDCPLLGLPLKRISEQFPKLQAQIIAIIRKEKVIFPKGDDMLKEGDEIYFCVSYKDVKKAMAAFGYKNLRTHKSLIVGGGTVGFELAKEIERHFNYSISAKVIEENKDRAELIANSLNKTKVILGNGKDLEILKEVGIDKFDSIITLTQSDEDNVLMALLGKKLGTQRAIPIIVDNTYDDLAKDLGIDSIISPQSIVSSLVLEQTKTKKTKSVHSIRNNFAEIMEIVAQPGSKITSDKVGDLNLPKTIKLGAVVKKNKSRNKVIIPCGDDKIAVGDTVILISSPESVEKVEKLFEEK